MSELAKNLNITALMLVVETLAAKELYDINRTTENFEFLCEKRGKLETYIAELEALVQRLVEAGNKLGTYFIGYTPRKKELLQREFWEAWRSAVSDWQSMTSHVTNLSDSQGIVTRNGGEG